jgi:hypothetical protein
MTVSSVGPIRWMVRFGSATPLLLVPTTSLNPGSFIKAPESLGPRLYSSKSDVWMFAALGHEVLVGCAPFPELSGDRLFDIATGVRDGSTCERGHSLYLLLISCVSNFLQL